MGSWQLAFTVGEQTVQAIGARTSSALTLGAPLERAWIELPTLKKTSPSPTSRGALNTYLLFIVATFGGRLRPFREGSGN